MKNFRIALTSVLLAMLCTANTGFASLYNVVQKSDIMKLSQKGKIVRGKRGERGKPGKRGKRGERGPHGGKQGKRGHHGERGHEGKRGHHGATGPTGATGAGITGATGATGPQGPGIFPFISATVTNQAPLPPIAPGDPIIFNSIVDESNSISYNGTNGQFIAQGAGSYEITYGATWSSSSSSVPAILGVRLFGPSGLILLASEVQLEQATIGDWATMSFIFTTTSPNPIFEVVNAGGSNMILGGDDHTEAFVTIKKIA
jgi:collagen triple helix repeat protein